MRWTMLFIGILLLLFGPSSIGAEERSGAHQAMERDPDCNAPMSITNMMEVTEISPRSELREGEGSGPEESACSSGDCPFATTVVTIGISI